MVDRKETTFASWGDSVTIQGVGTYMSVRTLSGVA